MRQPTIFRQLRLSLEHHGGLAAEYVTDSMAGVVDRWEGDEPILNLRAVDFATFYDIEFHIAPRGDGAYNARRERATDRRLIAARFPARKSLDNFDFKFQPQLDRERVLELATLDFVRRGQNLLVAGMSGTGKSHICIALGHLACAAGIRTHYTTSADMLADLQAALATGALTEVAKRYTKPQLLIIDEVGLDRPERDRGRDAQLFYKVVRPRH